MHPGSAPILGAFGAGGTPALPAEKDTSNWKLL